MNNNNPQAIWMNLYKDTNEQVDFAGNPMQYDQYMKKDSQTGWELLDIGNCSKSIEKGKYLLPVSIQTHKAADGKPVFTLNKTVFRVRRITGVRINYNILPDDKIIESEKKLPIEEEFNSLTANNMRIVESLVGKLSAEENAMITTAFVSRGFATKYNSEVKNIPLSANIELATLGDGILKSILTEHLFNKRAELGSITINRQKLESNQHLLEMGGRLLLKPISIPAETDTVRLMANIVEALVGVFHMLFGSEYAKRFVKRYLIE